MLCPSRQSQISKIQLEKYPSEDSYAFLTLTHKSACLTGGVQIQTGSWMGNINIIPKRLIFALTSPVTYKVITLMFAATGCIYVWAIGDAWWQFQSALDRPETETVNILGGEMHVSAIHGFVFLGIVQIAGPFAVGILAVQAGLLWRHRHARGWMAFGVVVCLICCYAILNWLTNL